MQILNLDFLHLGEENFGFTSEHIYSIFRTRGRSSEKQESVAAPLAQSGALGSDSWCYWTRNEVSGAPPSEENTAVG